MSVTFSNTTFGGGQSELGVFALNSFTGTGAIGGVAPVTINGTIDNPGSTVTINLNAAGLTAVGANGSYLGFSPADANGNYIYYFAVSGGGLVTPVTVGVTTAAAVPLAGVLTPVDTTNVTAPVCFVTGTRILTARGEVAVEDLVVGDMAVTAAGRHRPIVWLGHRDMMFADGRSARHAMPIRIRADAVAPGIPARDLLVSPGHRLFLDGVLVPANGLINGISIVREETNRVTYWHVELESHDLLVAEGMASESYIEAANRATFDNGEVVFGDRPVTSLALSKPACAPSVDSGAQFEAIRDRLLDRAREMRREQARALGAREIRDPSIQLLADGVALTPLGVSDQRFDYAVPEGTSHIVIASRSAVPRDTQPGVRDGRLMGVCVSGLALDGAPVAMGDVRLVVGWHEPEAEESFRWTNGAAELPISGRVSFRATPLVTYGLSDASGGPVSVRTLRLAA